VKKTVRIIALLNISVLYCLIISLYSSNALPYSSIGSKLSKSESKNYSALPVTDLICHLAPTAISPPACVTIPSSSLKNPFNEFFAWTHWSERAIFSTFSQYSFYSQNLLIRLEKTDIIFPFHYFW
jgi:hypothetical protein